MIRKFYDGRTTHRKACDSLAEHLAGQGYRAWVEVGGVGAWSYGKTGQVDVVALAPWTGRTKFDMAAYEVKVNRNDLQQDVLTGKWRRYVTEYGIPRVWFALIDEAVGGAHDIPSDAGLIIRNEKGAWVRKRAARSLEGDQRKLSPLLLLPLLSECRT